jgi:hypothetical protein
MTCKDLTLAYSPLLSTNKMMTGIHIENASVKTIGAGAFSVPIMNDSVGHDLGIDSLPVINDKCLFNTRLAWHVFTSNLYTFDNAIYNISTVASGNVVAQKTVVADWTVPNQMVPSVLTAKTSWIPFFTIDGRRLVVGVSAANGGSQLANIMAGTEYTGVASWLIKGTNAMPNAVIQGGGGNTQLLLKGRPRASNSSPSYEAVAVAGQEEPVVDL